MEAYNTGNQRIFECSNCGYGIFDIYISDEGKYPIEPKYCPNCGAKILTFEVDGQNVMEICGDELIRNMGEGCPEKLLTRDEMMEMMRNKMSI